MSRDDPRSAEEAFEALRAQVALMQRAVEGLAAEKPAGAVDYSPTLGAMAKSLGEIEARLEDLAASPALAMTPGAWAAGQEAAVAQAGRQAQDDLRKAETALRQATQRIEMAARRERTAKDQRRWLAGVGFAGVAAGIALYAGLAGPLARALPSRWHAPERLAARTIGLDRWAAGQRLMASASPQAWAEVARGSKLVTVNREVLDQCAEAAAKAGEAVRCRVEIAPPVSGRSGQD
ncbi:DUF6118 family protein [Caulobacter sp. NIBR2454]|uniref:DUF6118 family protein n=1 Tax=Caulobacter sp. NIBR2454 TaxID=3015996 RepID=UPI0022B61C73|nr:DUF6118 family protein [Caulobacter sp. NIBR2454]